MYFMRIFKERVKTSWGRDSMLLKDLLESRHHHRIYMNKTKQFKEGLNAFSGLHEGLVLLKDLSKPSTPDRTYMVKII
jgi:pSer/pThr/pTyr-binding forkhead associated (FHA) protein